ncbi:hypothetical protein Pth03_22140 [Planotetraspora thailandica]|uniref:Uncharacterized protein n=1 Tax=Planotetraspora thailandica TaxID=487172 RepID=A0A8J3XVA0_9ACTN|nr:hypothetical protein [Planotetraspora thailandica]GII53825.1 hypothetical protein Pth03_22140 [Planotetraspora thailandica]
MTRRLVRRAVPVCVLLVVLIAGSFLHATSVAHARTDPGRHEAGRGTPQTEVAQNASSARLQPDGSLSDIAGTAADDLWAVGQQSVWDVWMNRGVITHWNGSSWSEVGIRGDASGAAHLRSVAVAAPREVWTVGEGHDGLPYIAKGSVDGFDRVNVPQLRSGDWLGGVAAATGRVVAVGNRNDKTFMAVTSGPTKGTVWTTAQGPDGVLYGVTITGKSDGWAVGDTGSQPLIMRLTGTGWKSVRLPAVKGGFLRDVYAGDRKHAMAVGGVYQGNGKIAPLVFEWDGKRWSRQDPPQHRAELYGVSGNGDGTYWVSGYDPSHPSEGFVLRRHGSTWTTMRGHMASGDRIVRLQGVTRVADLTVAVGNVVDADEHYTDVVERFGPPAAKDSAAASSG